MLEGGFCSETILDDQMYSESLNPYYAGRWFLLLIFAYKKTVLLLVLILIMLEGGFCYFQRDTDNSKIGNMS